MMKMWIYKSVKNPEQGFTIQEETKKVYSIWLDPYQGGYACDSDWYLIDDIDEFPNLPETGEWKSFDDAYKWIVDNYGEITEIEDD